MCAPVKSCIGLGPVVGIVAGAVIVDNVLHDPTFIRALDFVLVCGLIGEGLAVAGLIAFVVLTIRAERPRARVAAPVTIRAVAEPITPGGCLRVVGPEPVALPRAQPLGIEPPRSVPPEAATAPERARVLRPRRVGAGAGPGR